MSDPEQTGGSSTQYRNIHINEGARAEPRDIYRIGREDPLSLLPFATQAPLNSYDRQHEPARASTFYKGYMTGLMEQMDKMSDASSG